MYQPVRGSLSFRHRIHRWIAGAIVPLLTLATLSVPASVQARENEPADPVLSAEAAFRLDREEVVWWIRNGGAETAKAAKAALLGSDAELQSFLATGRGELESHDLRVQVLRLMTIGGAGVRAAAIAALDGSDADREKFVESGWDLAWAQDERVEALLVHGQGGFAVKAAAKKALDTGDEAIATFLASGQFEARTIDERVTVLNIMGKGGPATREMAKAALDGGSETIHEFVTSGVEVARARDETLTSVTELAEQAKAAGMTAAAKTEAAKEAAARATTAADRAKTAAAVAAAETKAAKDSAKKAAAAAGRAADAAEQASNAAQVAISAAAQAHAAARAAADAAARAASLAVRAGDAATRAYNKASAAALDKNKAADASAAATDALKIVEAANSAAEAADKASEAAVEVAKAAVAASSASDLAVQAGASADEAGGYSQAAGAEADRARREAAKARAAAGRATRAAKAAVALANKAAAAAKEAGRAARQAGAHAAAAAAAAKKAAEQAGQAHDAAKDSKMHADAALVAAGASTAAAEQAATVQKLAEEAEVERLALATDEGISIAEAELRADQARVKQVAWDAEEQARRGTETNELLAAAGAPGAPVDVLLGKGRQAALRLTSTGGPYTRTAAEEALIGGEADMRLFLTEGLAKAAEQDDRARVAHIAETGEFAGLKAAAGQALKGPVTTVREFLNSRSYPDRIHDDRIAILKIMEAGGPATDSAAKKALDGSDADRHEFLARGQYAAAEHDERTQILQILSANPKPGPEVTSAAKIALAGPESYLRGFLRVGLARAQERDQLLTTHQARVTAVVAEARQAAATAQSDAYTAAQAAAVANRADADAARYAREAAASAQKAGLYADNAKKSAKQAKQSAIEAAASAATATKAAAAARADARKAEQSAADARWSAARASQHAANARASAEAARESAEEAGKSWWEARDASQEAYLLAMNKVFEEEEARLNNPDPDGDKKCNRPPGYGADPSCYPDLPGIERQADHGETVCMSWGIDDGKTQCGSRIVKDKDREIYEQDREIASSQFLCALMGYCYLVAAGLMNIIDPEAAEHYGYTLDPADIAMMLATRRNTKSLTRQLKAQNRIVLPRCKTNPKPKNSFDADTSVLMADGSTKPINAVKLHDQVRATDPITNVTGAREVTALHLNQDTALTDVQVRDDQGVLGTINTTAEHPFWNATRHAWIDAEDLNPGDELRTATGAVAAVATSTSFTGNQPMYNLTIADIHTYYVLAGNTPVLVHNVDPCKTGGSGTGSGEEMIRMRHYTNSKGAAGIQGSGVMKASDQNKVFMLQAKGKPHSPRDAEKKLGIKEGRGRKVIEFDVPKSRVSKRWNAKFGVEEWVADGDLPIENIKVVR
ncbi:polymorphic toxin-type HINT domain-containing protein [Actinoplanes sp. NEAU-A12]|uniref:Polymorphic toxin-type HINT domain-containing protein n=1 Tax=Actinoplanes sandaracinus TaxID=3045177 RepID=A0ABT6WTE5_9ACTN|nr:polymorphic toxin-type HINT domain-containing protein [Actinoplanes sandaracinus]MDI6103023.1 polymorphic toxin-type HINT domain-containing protein [Actinoplanes sandaracinus]